MNFGSGGLERPVSANPVLSPVEGSSTAVGEGWLLSDDRSVRGGDPVALAEVSFEPFKEIGPFPGPDDEDVAAIVLVPLAPEIAERAEGVQGARHHRLGNA